MSFCCEISNTFESTGLLLRDIDAIESGEIVEMLVGIDGYFGKKLMEIDLIGSDNIVDIVCKMSV